MSLEEWVPCNVWQNTNAYSAPQFQEWPSYSGEMHHRDLVPVLESKLGWENVSYSYGTAHQYWPGSLQTDLFGYHGPQNDLRRLGFARPGLPDRPSSTLIHFKTTTRHVNGTEICKAEDVYRLSRLPFDHLPCIRSKSGFRSVLIHNIRFDVP